MAKQVPYNDSPSIEVAAGGAPQLAATNVAAMQDFVTDDMQRMANAFSKAGMNLNALDDELNDAEAKKLHNEITGEIDAITNEYETLKGANAVATISDPGQKKETVLDDYKNKKLKDLLEEYQGKASNGVVKYMFENMASVSIKTAQNRMVKHSLTQQRKYLEDETYQSIETHKKNAKLNYKTWYDPTGEFNQSRLAGLALIEDYARMKGWNIDPNNGPISSQYLNEVSKYNLEIGKEVLDMLNKDKDSNGVKDFLRLMKGEMDDKSYNKTVEETKEKHEGFNVEYCVNSVLTDNGNQNNGDYLSQINSLLCLKSNHAFEDGTGAVVVDGLHSNQVEITEKSQEENIETLEQIKNTSKFYSPDSTQKGKLIPQHQTTHLFAVQHIGVEKADSFYTKAKNELDIDKEKYKNDSEYAEEINKKIIENYNKLISDEVNKKYARFGEGEYAITIGNDLEVIESRINYDLEQTTQPVEVNEITGLQPLDTLKDKLRATITDPKQLEFALKDLETKYNKISADRTLEYNQGLNEAKKIAFAEEDGWKNLVDNDILIEEFTEADQEILKNGQPLESDQETLAELNSDVTKVINDLPNHMHKLSKTDYLELEQYAASLQGDQKKVLAVTVDESLFKDVLYKRGFDHLAFPKEKLKGEDAATYNAILASWKKRIDYAQKIEGRTLDLAEKEKFLYNVLLDKVNVGRNYKKDITFTTILQKENEDKLSKVSVEVEVARADGTMSTDRIFTNTIPTKVKIAIMGSLYKNKKAMSQENIAQLWQNMGRPESLTEADNFIKASANYSLLSRTE